MTREPGKGRESLWGEGKVFPLCVLCKFTVLMIYSACPPPSPPSNHQDVEELKSLDEESTPAPTLQTTINSTLCGDIRLLLQQQGRDGRDGRDGPRELAGPQGPAGYQGLPGPSGLKGEKGEPGIQLQGPAGPQGKYTILKLLKVSFL